MVSSEAREFSFTRPSSAHPPSVTRRACSMASFICFTFGRVDRERRDPTSWKAVCADMIKAANANVSPADQAELEKAKAEMNVQCRSLAEVCDEARTQRRSSWATDAVGSYTATPSVCRSPPREKTSSYQDLLGSVRGSAILEETQP